MPIYRCTQCNHRFAVEDPKNAHCPQCKLEGELHSNDMLTERVVERDREIAELRRQLASLRPSPPPDHGMNESEIVAKPHWIHRENVDSCSRCGDDFWSLADCIAHERTCWNTPGDGSAGASSQGRGSAEPPLPQAPLTRTGTSTMGDTTNPITPKPGAVKAAEDAQAGHSLTSSHIARHELLPCPFCGMAPSPYGDTRCLCNSPSCPASGRSVTRVSWNSRAAIRNAPEGTPGLASTGATLARDDGSIPSSPSTKDAKARRPFTLADAVPCGQVLVAIEAVDRKFCDMLANWTWIPNGDVDEKDAPYADTCPVCRGGGIKQTAEDFDNCDCSDGWVVGRKFDEAKLREMAEAATLAMSRPPRGPLTGAEKEWLLWLEDGDKERYGDAHLAAELRSRRDDPTVDLRERYRDACEELAWALNAEASALEAYNEAHRHPGDVVWKMDDPSRYDDPETCGPEQYGTDFKKRRAVALREFRAAKLALDAAKVKP